MSLRLRGFGGAEDSDEYKRGYNDALAEVIRQNTTPPKRYHLTEQNGKAVQEILNRYVSELATTAREYEENVGRLYLPDQDEAKDYQTLKDIEYIEGLAKLFD